MFPILRSISSIRVSHEPTVIACLCNTGIWRVHKIQSVEKLSENEEGKHQSVSTILLVAYSPVIHLQNIFYHNAGINVSIRCIPVTATPLASSSISGTPPHSLSSGPGQGVDLILS